MITIKIPVPDKKDFQVIGRQFKFLAAALGERFKDKEIPAPVIPAVETAIPHVPLKPEGKIDTCITVGGVTAVGVQPCIKALNGSVVCTLVPAANPVHPKQVDVCMDGRVVGTVMPHGIPSDNEILFDKMARGKSVAVLGWFKVGGDTVGLRVIVRSDK